MVFTFGLLSVQHSMLSVWFLCLIACFSVLGLFTVIQWSYNEPLMWLHKWGDVSIADTQLTVSLYWSYPSSKINKWCFPDYSKTVYHLHGLQWPFQYWQPRQMIGSLFMFNNSNGTYQLVFQIIGLMLGFHISVL